MPDIPSSLTGTAGEHFVVYQLSCLGFVAALPRAGSMGADILVTNVKGNASATIQVKTTDYAMRTPKRGKNKKPAELQFPLGEKSARLQSGNLFFAFVDLRKANEPDVIPDVYVVPSAVVHGWCESWVDRVKWVRLHKPVGEMEELKNNWELISSRLRVE